MLAIHHIGYLVRKIDKAITRFEQLGYSASKAPVFDENRGADIVFMEKDGYCIELVSPHKTSDIYPLLKKSGSGPYHICYETDDLESATAGFEAAGYTMFREKQPAPAISGTAEVVFLYSAQLGMAELVRL